MMEKTIKEFIVLPSALKVFRRDQEEFRVSNVANVYMDRLDTVIEQLHQDINGVKKKLIYRTSFYNVHRFFW